MRPKAKKIARRRERIVSFDDFVEVSPFCDGHGTGHGAPSAVEIDHAEPRRDLCLMRLDSEKGRTAMAMTLEANRLESPAMTGYRSGMKSSCVIGRKLGVMYDVPSDMPRDFAAVLQILDKKLSR